MIFFIYTWTLFIGHKDQAFNSFVRLAKLVQNEQALNIVKIKNDLGREIENNDFIIFCDKNDIEHNFSTPRTL